MGHALPISLAVAAGILAIGFGGSLITSTKVASNALQKRAETAESRERTIFVKGSTRKRIRSDRAVWNIDVRAEQESLVEGFTQLSAGSLAVGEFLKQHNFTPTEIGLGAINTETFYARDPKGNETRKVAGYSLTRTYTVSTTDVDRVHKTAGEVTELIKQGQLVISRAPEYYFSELPQLKVELLGLASKDARSRADQISGNTGCRVADVRSASMGVLQVTRPDSTEVSDSGRYDTSTIDKDVTAVVTVTFRIE